MSTPTDKPAVQQVRTDPAAKPPRTGTRRGAGGNPGLSLYAEGEPMIWTTGGALAVALLMIVGMLLFVLLMGGATFWPRAVVEITTRDGRRHLGEITRQERHTPTAALWAGLSESEEARLRDTLLDERGQTRRRLIRTGNFDITGSRFHWVTDILVADETRPDWGLVIERFEWGPFYGTLEGFKIEDELVAAEPAASWARYRTVDAAVSERRRVRRRLERTDIGRINRSEERARLEFVEARRRHHLGQLDAAAMHEAEAQYERVREAALAEHAAVTGQIRELNRLNDRYALLLRTSDGEQRAVPLTAVVRAFPANRIGLGAKLRIFGDRWREFLTENPREANAEGGVFPAIVGTVTMTLVMTLLVVPFGVLAALYLREYVRSGPMVSAVRIAINNLAGVPSIVFGVFGLGFFCYIFGAQMDEWFYAARLPSPTFRKGGVLWASLTLALLTLPVVIVATEEALAAVPGSMREGSYACGASKWQTIKRIVLPRAMPGIMTGMILAMARGAGEVAPLMLVGAVKLAPDLPLDVSNWSGSLGFLPTGPIHLERSFMHLGFHIYDVGFQSPDSEAARPMVFTTTLLLIGIIVVLNLTAIALRSRLRRRFAGAAF